MAGLAQNPIIQLTGFKHSEKRALVKLLTELDCIYFGEQEYKQQCTHMIASKPSRSEKFLAACAAGKWVLTQDYIIDSAKDGRWLNEIQYEWGYKIPSISQYPVPMESVPKMWREELARSSRPGVFHNWKVVLLINDEARRSTFKRVLHAGKATVYHRPRRCCEITHVLTENRNYTMERMKNTYKAPYFPVEYIGQFILEPFCSKMPTKDVEISNVDFLDVDHISSRSFLDSAPDVTQIQHSRSIYFKKVKHDESSISTDFKHKLQMCLSSPDTIRSNYAPSGIGCCLPTSTTKHHQIQAMIFPGVTINRIEGILEGQFYMEALKEIRFHLSSNFFPPALLLQSLLQQILEGNVDMNFLCEFISIMETLILHHPPWQQSSIVSYYMEVLQCSSCKKGSFFLLESLARSCVYEKEPCHRSSNQELSISKLKPLYRLLLKYYFDLFEAELEALNKSCDENTNYGASRIIPPSVLAKVFLEYSDVMTNPVAVLLDCVLHATRAVVKKPNDRHLCETAYTLHGILGVVVEYRLLVNRLRGRFLSGRAWDDLQFYIPICCQDYNQDEIEMLFKLMPSPWLQMFTAQAMYKQICYSNGIEISEKSFSLHQIISSYLIALGRLGSCKKVMVKDPKEKKMGHQPCLEPLRPSLRLTSDRQNHVETLTVLAKQILPFEARRNSSLKSKETKIGSTNINQNGAILLQQQGCPGKKSLDCPNAKEDICTVTEVRMEDVAEGQFGNLNEGINSTETEPSAYLWSILLKNYIENHNLPLIYHVVNDSPLTTVQFVGKHRFENLKNSFPEQLMVQYAEDVKTYKELPKYIQQMFGNLRSGSLALGVNTQLLLLHIDSMFTHS
ncbi:SMC5-SMC6 complex localization factor protein 1 isoform X1 [Stegostoma tigrinum]|uniref:SMC5-SMC6 complex localization factor protein 1 isoform X1 n=2 Tax=Stegostoma tigrinum TaxID=3053191 RepID=UPI00202B7FAC|nr:SMC5-SMC6 complex localization factor protein 1 isoform X1 [Stegostoma tigrinum]